jgi:predicted esterase
MVEYPGYSIYPGKPSEEKIFSDADTIIQFLTVVLDVPLKNIILMGRSLGSGPATYIASKYKTAL